MPPEPVVPRPAATVLLVRDDPGQRRVAGMAFTAGHLSPGKAS